MIRDKDKDQSQNKFNKNNNNNSLGAPGVGSGFENLPEDQAIGRFKNVSELLYWTSQDPANRFRTCLSGRDGLPGQQPEEFTPMLELDDHIQFTLNENMHSYGSVTKTLFLCRLGNMDNATPGSAAGLRKVQDEVSTLDQVEQSLPLWSVKSVLMDKYPMKESHKIGFALIPDNSTYAELTDIKSTRLNGYEFLRISKLLDHVKGRLPQNQKSLPLELICKGHGVVDEKVTLATVKARLWKSSSDIEFYYRVKEGYVA
ncbi:unnamed protein product [Ambrosiozyma monospora]|uniref:Unnamed protein product n=1 Tax=Ambrosiozyma monospora TaxID=43982 RepID=A0ACB5T9T3_AMBMO|nr:unnamed protein product [Ambrosiozyma monospora]